MERTPPLWKEMKELLPASFFFPGAKRRRKNFSSVDFFCRGRMEGMAQSWGGGERRREKCLHQSARLSWARLVGLMMGRDVALHGDGRADGFERQRGLFLTYVYTSDVGGKEGPLLPNRFGGQGEHPSFFNGRRPGGGKGGIDVIYPPRPTTPLFPL